MHVGQTGLVCSHSFVLLQLKCSAWSICAPVFVCMRIHALGVCLLCLMYARVCVCPCYCMRVHPRSPRTAQRMSRGCGGSGGVGSVTQRGRWWDRTALQQWGTLQHQAGFEYCIRALELSPRTPWALWSSSPALNPHSGAIHQRFSASVNLKTLELMHQTLPQRSIKSFLWLSVSDILLMCVCLCKCDDMLGTVGAAVRRGKLLSSCFIQPV